MNWLRQSGPERTAPGRHWQRDAGAACCQVGRHRLGRLGARQRWQHHRHQRAVRTGRFGGLCLRQSHRRLHRQHAAAPIGAQDGDREAYKDALWWLLNERPMSGWSAATMGVPVSSRLFHGDAFARIHRASRISPTVAGFEPIHPDRIEVRKVDGRLHYVIAPDPQGDAYDTVTRTEVVDQDDMLHVAGPASTEGAACRNSSTLCATRLASRPRRTTSPRSSWPTVRARTSRSKCLAT